jgi:hypothetical protein
MASKSTGSAAVVATIVPDRSSRGGGGVGGIKNQQRHFYKPGRYNICTLNSEMKAKWRCSRGEMGAETRDNAVLSGL